MKFYLYYKPTVMKMLLKRKAVKSYQLRTSKSSKYHPSGGTTVNSEFFLGKFSK